MFTLFTQFWNSCFFQSFCDDFMRPFIGCRQGCKIFLAFNGKVSLVNFKDFPACVESNWDEGLALDNVWVRNGVSASGATAFATNPALMVSDHIGLRATITKLSVNQGLLRKANN